MRWKDKLSLGKILKNSKVRVVSSLSLFIFQLQKKKISRSKALLVSFFVLLLGTIIVYAVRIPVEEVVISIESVTQEVPCEQEREAEKLFFVPEGEKADSYIFLIHGERYITCYANLEEIKVKEGSTVNAGEVIGTTGNSATIDAGPGEHLHFALYLLEGEGDRKRKVALDPLEYLPDHW